MGQLLVAGAENRFGEGCAGDSGEEDFKDTTVKPCAMRLIEIGVLVKPAFVVCKNLVDVYILPPKYGLYHLMARPAVNDSSPQQHYTVKISQRRGKSKSAGHGCST